MRLVASQLACQRGGRLVFAGLDFALGAGDALIVTGANGAGKSSLLRLLAGLLGQAGGTVSLERGDKDLTIAEQSHFLGHLDPVKPALTVSENLHFWVDFLGGESGLAVREALAALGLADLADLPGAYLSAGQRRRLSLARLLAVKRPLWLLDEPTSTLDAAAQADFSKLVEAHLGGGGIAVVATHMRLGLEHARELELGGAA